MAINKYADDYETVVTIDEKGREKKRFVYRGEYYEIPLDQADIQNFRRNSFLLLSTITFLHLSSGFVSNNGMYQFYVALPYVIAFFPLMYMATGIFRLPKEKRKYQRDEIELSFKRMKTTSHVFLILLGMGILGEIIFIILSIRDAIFPELLYLLLQLIAAAAVYTLIRAQKQIQPQPCKKTEENT